MRLILFDLPDGKRSHFFPLTLTRPIWELRTGITSLGEKIQAKVGALDVACFVPDYLAAVYRQNTDRPVNDAASLTGDDLLLVNARVKADRFNVDSKGPSEVGLAEDGECLYARIAKEDLGKLKTDSIEALLASASAELAKGSAVDTWLYPWELILANAEQLTADFAALGRSGIEGTIEQPSAIRGDAKNVYIAKGVKIHPMAVIDAENGPVYLDEDVEVHSFSRIEGPCFVGRQTILLGAKCREGNSIGPVCRIGGEVEESIIQSHSNKYHDGFLGHAYVGQWVNLGAITSNSDLKDTYGDVRMKIGDQTINAGKKVGAFIGDHVKSSIGVLIYTGKRIGVGAHLHGFVTSDVPSYTIWAKTLGGGDAVELLLDSAIETHKRVLARRKVEQTDADVQLIKDLFEMTRADREAAGVREGRPKL